MAIDLQVFDFVGTDVPLRFTQGEVVTIGLEIVTEAGVAVDVTGRQYQVRIGPGDGGAAVATFTQTENSYVNGLVTLSLTSASITEFDDGYNGEWQAWEDDVRELWRGPVEVLKKLVV